MTEVYYTEAEVLPLPEMVIIEDEPEIAQSLPARLPIYEKYVNQVAYLSDQKSLAQLLAVNNPALRIFLVDIKIGSMNKAGLRMIELIRRKNPDDLIVVYTANAEKKECIDAGANYYFKKFEKSIEVTMTAMNSAIEEYIQSSTYYSKAVITYTAEIVDIDRQQNWVRLKTDWEGEEEDWEIELDHLSEIRNLSVRTPLRVTVVKHRNGYKVSFEEDQTVNALPASGSAVKKLIDLKIWSNKNP